VDKPSPKPTAETLPFWQACAEGRLVYQRCPACGRAQFPPRGHCAACHAQALTWRESARVGTIHTHTTVQRAPTARSQPISVGLFTSLRVPIPPGTRTTSSGGASAKV
jgi:uncharacterized OB-fold protein